MQINCKIMLVGMGNMGQALVKGWLQKGCQPSHITGVDPSGAADAFAKETGISYLKSSEELFGEVDVVVFAVKPQVMPDIVPMYAAFKKHDCLFVSIAAGVDMSHLQRYLGGEASVVRVMPNMPASIGLGASGLYADTSITQEHREQAEALLAAVGEAVWVESEDQLDVVTALSGSGPAYFFLMIEALAKAAMAQGLSEEDAIKLASATAFGAGAVAADKCMTNASIEAIESLREAVTSPAGTTYEGVKSLSEARFDEIVRQAIVAARERAYELRNS